VTVAVVNGSVVISVGVVADGYVLLDGGVVAAVGSGGPPKAAQTIDAGGGWIAPGFIDVQINGGHGVDLTTQPERIGELGEFLVRYGVTAFVPTIITCPPEARWAALEAWRQHHDQAGAAVPLGMHFEGPMLSPVRRGAHPESMLVAASADVVADWGPASGVVLATVAPELPGAPAVIEELTRRGVVVSLGHTDASAEQFAAGLAAGATYVTHLFNAMRPFSHRDPGPIGATLADTKVVAGLICDGIHVDPTAVRMAWRALGPSRLNLITDAVEVLGLDTIGSSRIGSIDVTVGAAGVRTADGVLAGSNLSLDEALRNLVEFTGCSVVEALATVTSTPADLLHLTDRGRLVVGGRADVTILDSSLNVTATIVGGNPAWSS
jgi:N-acetylglucosamine-6-phosphate deacetylase